MSINVWHDVPTGSNAPDSINVIVEIPRGSQNKYEFDKETNMIKLDRVLFSPMYYPGDYGLIPRTLGEDGDPLDALVLVTNPTYPGVLISAKPIGVLGMIDNGEGDDKILCVPADDARLSEYSDLNDVPKAVRDEIAHFFEVYKQLEGKKVVINGWKDAAEAKKIINDSIARYSAKFSQ
jgi:inorganic pyrophosphatase